MFSRTSLHYKELHSPEPNLMCVSQVPAAAAVEPCTFHSTTIAPGVEPRVEKSMSVISIVPTDPGAPTCTTGLGLVCDWKLEPVPDEIMVQNQVVISVWCGWLKANYVFAYRGVLAILLP